MLGSMQGASKVNTLHFLSLDSSGQLCMFTNPFNALPLKRKGLPIKGMFNGDYTVVIVLCEIQSGALHILFIGRDASSEHSWVG